MLQFLAVDGSLTVVRPGGLGDTILVLPALERLRRRFPGARLTLVGSLWAESLRPLVPFPLEVARFDGADLLPLFDPSAAADPTGLFGRAAMVLLYTDTPEEPLVVNARRFCPGNVAVWPVSPSPGISAADHFAAAVPGEGRAEPSLGVPEAMREWGRRWIGSRLGNGVLPLAVHPGSGGRRKCWPAAQFAEVARRWGRPVVLLEGPADRAAAEDFLAAAPGVPVARAAGLEVPQAASLIAGCAAFVGNDSGLSHLAAALGAPTAAVFGPTDPAIWAPRGRCVRVLGRGKGIGWPSVEEVAEALEFFKASLS